MFGNSPTNNSQQIIIMATTHNYKTPGVYVQELEEFPPSIVGVQTAIPVFIGYTEKAEISGQPAYSQAIKINSLVDYETIFGKGFRSRYRIKEVDEKSLYDFRMMNPADGTQYCYTLERSSSAFNLYNSVRLFYDNGGGTCYIISAGDYTGGGEQPEGVFVHSETLERGLKVAAEVMGPTMILMIRQAADLQDRIAILDVYGTGYATEENMEMIIGQFRLAAGDTNLSYGAAYFPFLQTTVVSFAEVTYESIDVESQELLQEVLTWQNIALYNTGTILTEEMPGSSQFQQVQALIDEIGAEGVDPLVLDQSLIAALPVLQEIEKSIVLKENVLPPGGALAGIYTRVDNEQGIWNAPANISVSSVAKPTLHLTNEQQSNLNMPLDGKAVNAIREFPGRGTVVWGARTLDGNSYDWRYIQVRRTLIYIEQSIKSSLNQFVFAANDGKTWMTVVAIVSSFLHSLWSQGGLMGASASEAYRVECGLGSTMTGQDILDGYMIVQVTLQLVRPAEFIELTFRQKMEGIGS